MEYFKKIGAILFMVALLNLSAKAQIDKIIDIEEVNGKNFGFTISGESAGDDLGRATLFADVNGDGYDDLIIDAGSRNSTGNNRGILYVLFGSKELPTSSPDLSNLNGSNGFVLQGEFSDGYFGARMASGDINGDNFEDLIIADPSASPFGRPSTAAVYVLFGKSTWSDTLKVSDFNGTDGIRIYGNRYEDPEYVASGDLNDDGFDDIIIGSDFSSDPDTYAGRVTVIYGKATAFEEEISTLEDFYASHGPVFWGTQDQDWFGQGLATGDFNNDGKTDFFVSATRYHNSFYQRGRVYAILGSDSTYSGRVYVSNLMDETQGFHLTETSSGCCHYSGEELKVGDTNGDGYDDIIIGSPNYYGGSSAVGRPGRVVVVRGNPTIEHETFGSTGINPYAVINGITDGDRTGFSLATDDLNLDGNDDIIIGAYKAKIDGSNETGAVYVVYGPVLSDIDLENLTEEEGFVLRGDLNSTIGVNVSTGDMNNDGIPEIAIGAYRNDPDGIQSGEVFVITNIASQTIQGDEGFRMLAAPIQGKSISNMFGSLWTQGLANSDAPEADPNLWKWNHSTQNWTAFTDLNVDSVYEGRGFLAYLFSDDDGDGIDEEFPKTISAPGSLYPINTNYLRPTSDSVSIYSPSADKYLFLGNIFPYTIDWDDEDGWTESNLSTSMYAWSDSANTWYSYNRIIGNKPDSGLIAPFQSVFLKVNASGNSGSVKYTTLAKAENEASHLKTSRRKSIPQITGQLKNGEFSNSFNILFHEQGKWERDPYDADLLVPFSNTYLQAGVYQNGEILSIASLPDAGLEHYELPLYMVGANTSKKAELIIEMKNFMNGYELVLRNNSTGKLSRIEANTPIHITVSDYQPKPISKIEPPVPISVSALHRKTKPEYSLIITGTTVSNESENLPMTFALDQNYPNPFNPTTVISYQLPENSLVDLRVFDMLGREVANLVSGQVEAGYHQVQFNARDLASGVYIYRLQAGDNVFAKKLTLIK